MSVKRILIVDDEEEIRSFLKEYFEGQGFVCTEASNGREALDIFRAQSNIPVIVSDIRMPEMDGMTLLEELQKFSNTPKVILMSAYTTFSLDDARDKGAFALISKPFPMSVMMESVLNAFK